MARRTNYAIMLLGSGPKPTKVMPATKCHSTGSKTQGAHHSKHRKKKRNRRRRHPRIVWVDLAKEADKLQPIARCTGQLCATLLDLVIVPAQLATPNTALSGVAWRKARHLRAICHRDGLRVYTLGGLIICEAPKCYQILPYCLWSLLKYPPTYQRLGTKTLLPHDCILQPKMVHACCWSWDWGFKSSAGLNHLSSQVDDLECWWTMALSDSAANYKAMTAVDDNW